MAYHETVKNLDKNAEQLEQLYQTAVEAGDSPAFKRAIEANFSANPENLLFAAWYHRLKHAAVQAKENIIAWRWVIPLAAINGFLFWLLSDDERMMLTVRAYRGDIDFLPAILLLAAPLTAILLLIYLAAVRQSDWQPAVLIILILVGLVAYTFFTYPQTGTRPFQEQYLSLMLMHLPLLAWAGIGFYLVRSHREPIHRFNFLIKSLEAIGLGGLLGGLLLLFNGITVGLFSALDINLPTTVLRFIFGSGIGIIMLVTPIVVYNPKSPPASQKFDPNLQKLVTIVMRVLLLLTVVVLALYLLFIPFNFRAPFDNRDVLVIYNTMLFAIVALLVGASWINLSSISPQMARWTRRGITAVAILALIVSFYALAAILFRTFNDRLTPNRFAFIGWNVVNSCLLILILFWQRRSKESQWLDEMYRAFGFGTMIYTLWALVVILMVPWMFGINQGEIEALPTQVQQIIYERPNPVLLKCQESPHIYLLERGQKRWIDTIDTFNSRGYVWADVNFITCDNLRLIPDGLPIPEDAGSPATTANP